MFILDEPYVSPQLRRAAAGLGAPVLDNACARRELRGVPIHVEFRIADDGTVRPIEANPLRFGGWCATDIASHGWGFCPYAAFLLDQLDEVLRADLTEYVQSNYYRAIDSAEALMAKAAEPCQQHGQSHPGLRSIHSGSNCQDSTFLRSPQTLIWRFQTRFEVDEPSTDTSTKDRLYAR